MTSTQRIYEKAVALAKECEVNRIQNGKCDILFLVALLEEMGEFGKIIERTEAVLRKKEQG